MLFLNGEPFLKDSLDVKNATFYFYGRIATDKHHVFFDRKQLDDINAATFRQISDEVFEDRNYIYTIKEIHGKKNIHLIKKGKSNQIYFTNCLKISLIGYKAKNIVVFSISNNIIIILCLQRIIWLHSTANR